MGDAISDVVSGALYHEMRMSTLANNIANISTAGFKEDRVAFEISDPDAQASGTSAEPISPQTSYMGNPILTYTNFDPGHIVATGNPLDFALEGDGFFKIQTPEGTHYTRSGTFVRNVEGVLVTPEGHPVMGEGGEILLGNGRIEVDGSGNILADGAQIDRFEIVDFPEGAGLMKAGKNGFVAEGPDADEQPAENAVVMQGSIERSNVDAVKSMTEMIEVIRGYESYQKMIQYLNEANEKIISQVGAPA